MEDIESQTPQEVAVRRLGKDGAELAVFEFQGKLRDLMISSFQTGFLETGTLVPSAKAISPQSAKSVAMVGASAGASALSAQFASTLFVATANPATLMSIRGGVGSAVMGTQGILQQAPFLPVASSLPIVAPILAIQALNTAMMMQEFKKSRPEINWDPALT